jgi:PAS domain S-box-containing protein
MTLLEKQAQDPRFFLHVFETMREGVMIIDDAGNINYFNKAAEEITGYAREEVLGKSCVILDSDTCVVLTSEGKQRKCDLFKGVSICNKRCRIKSRDGKSVYLLKNAVLLRDEEGTTIGAVETLTDVTSLYMKELELEELKEELRQEYWFMGLLGWSGPMQRLYEQIRNAALSEAPVLIFGESGTGKNLTANAIHALGRRREKPFIKMNCSALNENLLESELFGHKKGSFTGALSDRIGRFEAADGGSILLDEIGDMSPLMQAKLLRVLEEKVVERVGENEGIPVNVRVISATNRDLPELIRESRFREDLYYRVNAISIRTPTLRERPDDIPTLTSHFLKKISVVNNKDVRRVSPPAMDLLCHYHWPGNVRQLMSALEHSAITCSGDTVEISDLPDYLFQAKPGEPDAKQDDRARLAAALALCKGNKTQAAKHLGISRVTLWKKLKAAGLD